MKNQFLTRKQVAERMNVCPKLAMAILENEGVNPIDLGRGKKTVLRWPEDVVQAVMTNIGVAPIKSDKNLRIFLRPPK